jgi:HK97 family phage portal protein
MANFWVNIWNRYIGSGSARVPGIQYTGPLAYETESALPVTEESAMQVSAVWACVKLITETVSSLPIHVYRKTDEGRELENNFWFSKMMAYKPNRYQNRLEFFETLIMNLVLHGNAYCKIDRRGGEVYSLMPLMSAQVVPTLQLDGSVTYEYTDGTNVDVYSSQSIWHIKLFGNAIVGKSPLSFGRNIFGIAQAAEKTVTKIYNNGGKPSGVLSFDRLLTPEQRTKIRENFSNLTTGTDDRLLVLESGMKFDQISLSPQDIELLQSRKFQIEEICRWFGVPSVLVNDTGGSTAWGSGIEQLVSGFYKLNLRPYLERIEASVNTSLFTIDESMQYEVEFDFEGLLRSDFKSRVDAYKSAIAGSVMTPNEARKLEGLPIVDGGDILFSPLNMTAIDKMGQERPKNGL